MADRSILLVDDDKDILEAMADYLRSLNLRVETADSYSPAADRLEAFPFELVVCDINLPDRDGFSVQRNTPEVGSLREFNGEELEPFVT